MNIIKSISLYIIIATFVVVCCNILDSNVLFDYLKSNIIGLLFTILAINTATLGLIASKIQDITKDYPGMDFSLPIKEMKISLTEQIVLIISSIVTLILVGSPKIVCQYKTEIGDIILTTILIYFINILWDTGKAVFIIIDELQKMNKK